MNPEFDAIANRLYEDGIAIDDALVPSSLWRALAWECAELSACGQLSASAIGAARQSLVNPEQRSDQTSWLAPETSSATQRWYLELMENLRLYLNQNLQLGLFDYECHFAVYPVGGFYRKHLDQFHGSDLRQISSVLYLNENWQSDWGGQLRIYPEEAAQTPRDIDPDGGRLVLFASGRFYHEVLPSARPRQSLTGWFRRRR